MRLEDKRALRLVQRIARGVFATRTSVDWSRMSRGISERRWVQDRILLERTAIRYEDYVAQSRTYGEPGLRTMHTGRHLADRMKLPVLAGFASLCQTLSEVD